MYRRFAAPFLCATLFGMPVFAQSPDPTPKSASLAMNHGDWATAISIYTALTVQNPYESDHWNGLGLAFHSAGRFEEAFAAWSRAAECSRLPGLSYYNLACVRARQGKADEAVHWLDRALRTGFRDLRLIEEDSDLESIRALPAFRDLTGFGPPENLSRDARWQYDLDHLIPLMERIHFSLYAHTSRDEFLKAVSSLKARVPSLTNERILIGIQRIIAMAGDGHTTLPIGVPAEHGAATVGAFHRYEISLYQYTDGLFVRAARGEAGDLAGARILKLGGKSPEEALALVAPMVSRDNLMGVRLQAPQLIAVAEVAQDIGLAGSDGTLEVVAQLSDGTTATRTLKPAELRPIGSPGAPVAGVTYANARSTAELPLYLRKPNDFQWIEPLPELEAVYFKFNAVLNPPDRTLAQSVVALLAAIHERHAKNLIIDLRDNGGGNNQLMLPLIHALLREPEVSAPGHLFVIIGRRTFSAAMNTAAELEKHLHPIFVGEPTGSSPIFIGESTRIRLPANDVTFTCSSLYWQSAQQSADTRAWITPTILAEFTSSDFANNIDPALDAIKRRLAAGAK